MKKRIDLKELGKAHTISHLKLVHPFLRETFRPLDKKELKSEKVFKELFGDGAIVELWKLAAIYEIQN